MNPAIRCTPSFKTTDYGNSPEFDFLDYPKNDVDASKSKGMPISELESADQYKIRLANINLLSFSISFKGTIGRQQENLHKNRYPDVIPNDESRVILKHTQTSDYINASWYGEEAILTQGPMYNTKSDLWLMAFENNGIIICVTDQYDSGLKEKTTNYWDKVTEFIPSLSASCGFSVDDAFIEVPKDYAVEDITLGLTVIPIGIPETVISHSDQEIIRSAFEVTLGNEKKTLYRLYLKNWPDMGTCSSKLVVKLIDLFPEDLTPIIHCSAGIGRAGVVAIANHFIKAYNQNGTIPTEDEIDAEIIKLRKERPGIIQKYEQRQLITKAILKHISSK